MSETRTVVGTDERRRRSRRKARTRALVALVLLVLCGGSALTGLFMYAAPTGRRSGQLTYLLFTKQVWGDVHFWLSVAAGVVLVVHVIIDWKALRSCMKFLTSADRPVQPTAG